MKTIALIASLDTKEEEVLYAQNLIHQMHMGTYLIDVSTRKLKNPHADLSAEEILTLAELEQGILNNKNKADCIKVMEQAAAQEVPKICEQGVFQGILSIGGGQNAKIAAAVMKKLPVGMPKMIVSPIISGKRTMEQFVGDKDIILMHSMVDFSGLNRISCTIIENSVRAMVGMLDKKFSVPTRKKQCIGLTMLGITTEFANGVVKGLKEEILCFHANGTGGRCFENLINQGEITVALDANLHEVTAELFGGYSRGISDRMCAAGKMGIPIICIPGAIDVIDYYFEDEDTRKPERFELRKKYFHNRNVCHCKVLPDEMKMVAVEVAKKLNQAIGKVKVILPLGGFCEEGRIGGALYDPTCDQIFLEELPKLLREDIQVIVVDGNINDQECINVCIREVEKVLGEYRCGKR